MLSWIGANIGTILVALVLLAAVVGIVLVMKRDKKRGKSPCGNCGHCPMRGSCQGPDKIVDKSLSH